MIHVFMYDSSFQPLSPFVVSYSWHVIPEWFTFWRMYDSPFMLIHFLLYDSPFMYDSPFHVWFIFSWTIHLFMYDSPFHLWFTFSCMIHLFMHDSPFHEFHPEWFIPFCWTIHQNVNHNMNDDSPFHTWMTFSCKMIHLFMNVNLLLNDSFIHLWFTWKGACFTFWICDFHNSWMNHESMRWINVNHLFMHDSPKSFMKIIDGFMKRFHEWFTFSSMKGKSYIKIHLFLNDSPFLMYEMYESFHEKIDLFIHEKVIHS